MDFKLKFSINKSTIRLLNRNSIRIQPFGEDEVETPIESSRANEIESPATGIWEIVRCSHDASEFDPCRSLWILA